MVVDIKNPYEGTKTELIAQEMGGKRTFAAWPFLQECLVVDLLFKYEKMSVVSGSLQNIITDGSAWIEALEDES